MGRCAALGKIMNELTFYVEDSFEGLEPECGSDPVLAKILIDTLENKEEQFKAISSDGSLFIFNGIYWDRVKHNDLISMALLFDGLALDCQSDESQINCRNDLADS